MCLRNRILFFAILLAIESWPRSKCIMLISHDFPTFRTLLKNMFWISLSIVIAGLLMLIQVSEEFKRKGKTACSQISSAASIPPITSDLASLTIVAISWMARAASPFLFFIVATIDSVVVEQTFLPDISLLSLLASEFHMEELDYLSAFSSFSSCSFHREVYTFYL